MNECIMCGMSIPEDQVVCKECTQYCEECILPRLPSSEEIEDLINAMYEHGDELDEDN